MITNMPAHKRLLAIAILATLNSHAIASEESGVGDGDYFIKIHVAETLSYWDDGGTRATTWKKYGEPYNCNDWSSFDSSAEPGTSYLQQATCSQDETRTVTYISQDRFSDAVMEQEEIERRTIDVTLSRSVNVVSDGFEDVSAPYDCSDWEADSSKSFSKTEYHRIQQCSVNQSATFKHMIDGLEAFSVAQEQVAIKDIQDTLARDNRSCLTLLEQDSSLKNDVYPLKGSNYQCDMAGGGWTLVNYTDLSSGNYGDFSKTSLGGKTALWAIFHSHANGSYQDRKFFTNTDNLPWSQAKITFKAELFSSVDSYSNTHGGAVNRDDVINGMFFDGLSITTDSGKLVHAVTRYDNAARRSQLGIPDSKSFIGSGTHSFTFDNGSITTDRLKLRGIADQYYSDEAVGFSQYVVWLK